MVLRRGVNAAPLTVWLVAGSVPPKGALSDEPAHDEEQVGGALG